jgi:Carboxypeptidase regulatory-like domain/TonB dependent receptor-like, beta-barrel
MKTVTHPRGLVLYLVAVISALMISALAVHAQSESGSSAIEGSVRDANGASVAGASLIVRNVDTGLSRNATSGSNGDFNVPVLPVGHYTVRVEAKGFGPAERTDVMLRVGEATTVDFTLKPADVNEIVTITPDPEVLDREENATSSTIPSRSVHDLPARGRNFSEYVLLTPAVMQESDRQGLVIAGQRSINSNVAVDGADFNDSLQGNQRGGNEAVFFFPQTAIREFQVVRSGATAEVGRTNAGFVNAVTKSGTNAVHGEGFFFNRNHALTSPDAFGNKLHNKQNQFGGSIGGPLKHDRAFFFFGVEQNFLQIPFLVKFLPPPSGITVPANLKALEGEQHTTNNPTALFGRVDFNLSKRNTLNLQYTYSRLRGENFNFDNNTTIVSAAAENNYHRISSSNGFKVSLVSIINSKVVNEGRGQIATDNRLEDPNTHGPQSTIADFATLGGDTARPRLFNARRIDLADNLTVNSSAHHLRFGFDTNINRASQQRESNTQARWDFETRVNGGALVADGLQNYLAVRPRRYRQTFPVAGLEDLVYRGTQEELALFANDRIAISRTVTLTAGLRWEGQWNPVPPRPNPAIPETALIPNDLNMWQPRLGLAWDVNGKSKTIVRLSAGLYDARTPANLFQRVFTDNGLTTVQIDISEPNACRNSTDPNRAGCLLRGPNAVITYPNAFTSVPTNAALIAKPRVFGFDPTFRNPRSFQAAGTIEHELSSDVVVTVGYIHNSTWALQRRRDRNLFAPTINAQGTPIFPATRPNTTINQLEINESTAHSTYDGMTLSLNKRFLRRSQFTANYTLARSRDDDSNERNFSREVALNPFDFSIENTASKQDIRHTLSLNGLVDLGHGFTASGIIITRSAVPFTAVIGSDQQNDLNDDNDRAIINGVVAGRNSFRQPYFFNLDLRLLKGFHFGETRRLDLSVEAFNVTRNGNKNFANDAISIYGVPLANGAPSVPTAGQPLFAPSSARFGGPRQVQLGARFIF